MTQQKERGFAVVEVLLVLVILGIVGFTGWFVWHSKLSTERTLDATATSAEVSTPRYLVVKSFDDCKAAEGSKLLETYPIQCQTKNGKTFTRSLQLQAAQLKYEKLQFKYDPTYWQAEKESYSVNETCGHMDSQLLSHGKTSNVLFSFGVCGKGGGACFDGNDPDCKAESKLLANVDVTPADKRYILAYRSTSDHAKTWTYDVWLTDSATCSADLCTFTAKNVEQKIALVSATFTVTTKPGSLDEFAQMDEVQAAVALLKTVHY